MRVGQHFRSKKSMYGLFCGRSIRVSFSGGDSMLRAALRLGGVAGLLAIAGCTMCCHPYDYCGPVLEADGCQTCASNTRAGSILAGTREAVPSPEPMQHQSQPATLSRAAVERQIHGDQRLGDVPGSQRMLSEADRVVDSGTTSTDQPQVAAELLAEPAKPLPTQGWTARRPTQEVLR
jgi:hypothetical protein